ncbi:hypothetical protein X551_02928 [Methylibium sp. T29]|nr:hypothetical protein X551_02928 [Methylibium sp. T29]
MAAGAPAAACRRGRRMSGCVIRSRHADHSSPHSADHRRRPVREHFAVVRRQCGDARSSARARSAAYRCRLVDFGGATGLHRRHAGVRAGVGRRPPFAAPRVPAVRDLRCTVQRRARALAGRRAGPADAVAAAGLDRLRAGRHLPGRHEDRRRLVSAGAGPCAGLVDRRAGSGHRDAACAAGPGRALALAAGDAGGVRACGCWGAGWCGSGCRRAPICPAPRACSGVPSAAC